MSPRGNAPQDDHARAKTQKKALLAECLFCRCKTYIFTRKMTGMSTQIML